jgi:hypothetical protein
MKPDSEITKAPTRQPPQKKGRLVKKAARLIIPKPLAMIQSRLLRPVKYARRSVLWKPRWLATCAGAFNLP